MLTSKRWIVSLILGGTMMIGCQNGQQNSPPAAATNSAPVAKDDKTEAKIAKAIQELPEGERAQAVSQRLCPVEDGSRLGSMGKPYKIVIEERTVFLCCAACEDQALAHPKETLTKLDGLKKSP